MFRQLAGSDHLEPELPLADPQSAPDPETVAAFVSFLKGRGWLTARAICCERPEWYNDEYRLIRRLANASGGEVLSGPGCPGYCLTRENLGGVAKAGARWRAQRNEMDRRWIAIQRVAHAALTEQTPVLPPVEPEGSPS
jgi:hypothetical protein